MALQCVHAVSILKCVVTTGEGTSRLGIFSRGPPLSSHDMFFVIRRGLGI
jgi:hypothetical protein